MAMVPVMMTITIKIMNIITITGIIINNADNAVTIIFLLSLSLPLSLLLLISSLFYYFSIIIMIIMTNLIIFAIT